MNDLIFAQHQQRNDYNRKIGERVRPPLEDFDVVERRIRADLRKSVALDLKYTTRGKRGAGKTNERLLNRVMCCRQQHSMSIRRQREWGGLR
jgi:hypothetical protein